MKVAIIGAGVSGLSCAYELERNGITPVIFEKRSHIGEPLGYASIWSRVLSRPIVDPVYYLKRKYGVSLKPLSRLAEIVMKSQNSCTTVKGNLGYIFNRGTSKISIENQIGSMISTPVIFDSHIRLEDIKNDFEYIVVATGSNAITKQLDAWTDTFISYARTATVLGNFKTDKSILWMDTRYAKNAFCYLVPRSAKEASLVLIVNGITHNELDYYWKEFLSIEEISDTIIETRDAEHFCGIVKPHRVGNVFFTGNAAGFTDNLIGVGGINAVESGVLAARAIVQNHDYDKLVNYISKDIMKLHELRKVMNTFDNKAQDRFLNFIGMPVIKQTIYNNPFFKLSQVSFLAKLYSGKSPV